MAKKKNQWHMHQYKKVNIGVRKQYVVYKCIKPGCSHYIPINQASGAMCECSKCYKPMVIGKVQLYGSGGGPMAEPHCEDCIKRKKNVDMDAISSFIQAKE